VRSHDPGRELLLCCARTRVDAPTRERIAALVRKGPDWERLLASARSQQVTALVANTLCGPLAAHCPLAVVERLRGEARGIAVRSVHLAGALLATLDILDAEGIAAIPYKGPVLSAMAYGDLGLRLYGDLDVWVHPWDYRFRIPDALVRHGWSPLADYAWERSFRHRETGAVLDVHQYLTHRRTLPFSLRFDEAFRNAAAVEVAGRAVRTLDPARMLVVLCVQLAKDAGEIERSPLIKVCDIAELVARHPALDWGAIERIARREGVLRVVALGLAVTGRLLGARLPDATQGLVRGLPDRDALVRHVEERIFGDDPGPGSRPGLRDPVAWNAAIRERFRDRDRRMVALLQDVLVPNEPEFRMLRLPKPMFAAYRVIRPARLAIKYLGIALGVRSRHKPSA